MDHIRKALKQAEKDRLASEDGSVVAGISETPDQQAKLAENRQQEPAETVGPEGVTYKQTKVVAVSPEVFERQRLVAALPRHPLVDSYTMLRSRVLEQMKANNWRALAITSPATGSGKTLTAINLAINLAREVNSTVLLVDLDLRNPSIHTYFEYEPQAGIGDFLKNDTPIEDALFSPGIDRLVVLPGREKIVNSAETLRSPKMVELVAELKNRYPDRLVICDLPPILATDDALAFAPYTDAMLMVAEAGSTKRDDLERSLDVLQSVPLIGTVLNKSEATQPAHYGSK